MTIEHKTDLTSYYLKIHSVMFDLFGDHTPDINDDDYWIMLEGLIGEELIVPGEHA